MSVDNADFEFIFAALEQPCTRCRQPTRKMDECFNVPICSKWCLQILVDKHIRFIIIHS